MPHAPTKNNNNNNQTTGRRRSNGLRSQDGSAPATLAPSTTSTSTLRMRHLGCFSVTRHGQSIVRSWTDTAAVETDSSSSDAAPIRTTTARSRRDAAGESSRPDLTSGRATPRRTSSAMASAFARMDDDVGCALPSDPDAGPDGAYMPPAWRALDGGSSPDGDYMPPAWSFLRDGAPGAGDAGSDSGDEYGPPLTPPSEAELFDRHLSDSALGIPAEPGSGKTRLAGREQAPCAPSRSLSFQQGAAERLSLPPEDVQHANRWRED